MARRERALPQQVELVLVQAALEPEQEPVVAVPRGVDRLPVHQHRVDDPAHLDELLPVAAVAGEARHFPRRHRAHLAQADLGDHPLEAGAGHAARGGAPEVVVHDLDLRPAERREPVAHGVLQRAAFRVVQDLVRGGLPHVHDRPARQVMRLDLVRGHGGDLLRAVPRPRRAGAAAAPPGRPGSAASPRAAPTRPRRPGRSPQETGRTGRIAELGAPASPGGGLGGVAWASPRFWSGESPSAAEAEASVGPEPVASANSRRKAESAPTPTRGRDATARGTQASRSNIQAGTSRHRPASPARLHRNAVAFPLSLTSWTWTERPLHGCHGYKSVRSVVLWAFSRRVVQQRTPARVTGELDPAGVAEQAQHAREVA
jgi:hypothetical protein